ncbi:ClbS/DfsB family four-helix bundle protein [Arcobacter caeni]|jgi:hypothetical protein|uniref:ClbS/DfsB family four-helix bundle protein n=1 Tax=Arcobacter caeni TaxID=1912877 RepID=A0A363CX59_9BACT|nr:ClbS/DfsB family four-helix bundle protein [Arcobacter caeni]PUE63632.1 hypothetical protein B0174_09970 [Arcobacter caeni]
MTSVPQNKQELLQSIQKAYKNILADYSTLSEESSRVLNIEGNIKGTMISVCDTLAYLIGWGKLVLKWYDRKSAGLEVIFPENNYKWNELGKLAQNFHFEYASWSYSNLINEFKEIINKIITLIENLSNSELYEKDWYEKYTLGRMIQFNTSSPMKNMRTKIRKFKKAKL